jgi:hypothetical protein
MREQVLLAQRIAIARAVKVPWAEIAAIENMRERTLRHLHRRWRDDLARETEPPEVLLAAVQRHAELHRFGVLKPRD